MPRRNHPRPKPGSPLGRRPQEPEDDEGRTVTYEAVARRLVHSGQASPAILERSLLTPVVRLPPNVGAVVHTYDQTGAASTSRPRTGSTTPADTARPQHHPGTTGQHHRLPQAKTDPPGKGAHQASARLAPTHAPASRAPSAADAHP